MIKKKKVSRVPRYFEEKMDCFWLWVGVWEILEGKVSGGCPGEERVGLCLVGGMSGGESGTQKCCAQSWECC